MADKPINPDRAAYVERKGLKHYKARYDAGWRYSMRVACLDAADADGRSWDDAWMDGYLDAANRDDEKWHLLHCQAHHNNEGGCGRA